MDRVLFTLFWFSVHPSRMNSVAFTDRKSASQIYRRLVKCIPSALMPFRPCSTGLTRSARCMPRTAAPAHRVVPVRNRANIISVSTFIGSAAFLLFFAATEGNDRARARLVFIIYKRCESGGYMPSRIHLNRTAMNERVELSTHAEISTAWKVGSIIAGASPRE